MTRAKLTVGKTLANLLLVRLSSNVQQRESTSLIHIQIISKYQATIKEKWNQL